VEVILGDGLTAVLILSLGATMFPHDTV